MQKISIFSDILKFSSEKQLTQLRILHLDVIIIMHSSKIIKYHLFHKMYLLSNKTSPIMYINYYEFWCKIFFGFPYRYQVQVIF